MESTKACGLSPVENAARLEECLTGPARDAVEGWLDNPNSVPLVIKTLQRLYGRPSLVVKDLLEKVRRTAAPRPEQLHELITFGLAVLHLCDHLSNADLAHYLSNPELLEELVEKLPATRQLEWVRYSKKYLHPTLKEFGMFMDKLVDEASAVTKYVQPKANVHRPAHRMHVHSCASSEMSVVLSTPPRERQTPTLEIPSTPCHLCKNTGHKLRECEAFKRMSPVERVEAVTRMKLCRNCLANHGTKPCRSKFSCGVPGCDERHHSLLQRLMEGATAQTAQCQTHQHSANSTLFRVVPVTVYNGNRRVDTHAFLDEGSSLTLIEDTLAASIGLKGHPDPLELQWTANVKRKEESSHLTSLEISARGGERRYPIAAAHTVKQLSLPQQKNDYSTLISSYDYLQDLPAEQHEDGMPRILIGLENVHLLTPLESRSGQSGGPIAVRTVLGWSVYGPHKENTTKRQPATANSNRASQQQDLSAPIGHVPEMNAVSLLCDDHAVTNQQHPCNFSSPTATAASYRTIRGADYHHHRVTIPGGEVVSITKNIQQEQQRRRILTPFSSTAVDKQPLPRPNASICSQSNICSNNPSSNNNAYDTQQPSRISRTNSMALTATIALPLREQTESETQKM